MFNILLTVETVTKSRNVVSTNEHFVIALQELMEWPEKISFKFYVSSVDDKLTKRYKDGRPC